MGLFDGLTTGTTGFGQPQSPLTAGLLNAAMAAAQAGQPSRLPISPLATVGAAAAGFGQGVRDARTEGLKQNLLGDEAAKGRLGLMDQLTGINARRAFQGLPALTMADLGLSGGGGYSGMSAGDGTVTAPVGANGADAPGLLPLGGKGGALPTGGVPTRADALRLGQQAGMAGYKDMADFWNNYALKGVDGREYGADGALVPIRGGPADPATLSAKALADKGFVQDASGAWRNPAGAAASAAEIAAATTAAQEAAKLPYSTTEVKPGTASVPTASLLGNASGVAPTVSRWAPMLADASAATGVPEPLLRAMMGKESSGDPNLISGKGATGLMQLMPDTAKTVGVTNVFDPAQNLRGGAEYYKRMLSKYGGDPQRALIAYNWGPGNLDLWLARGRNPANSEDFATLPGETRDYVAKLLPVARGASASGAAPDAGISTAARDTALPSGLVRLPGGGLYNSTPAVTQVEAQAPYKVESQKHLAEMMKTVQGEGAAAPDSIRQLNELRGALSVLNTGPGTVTLNEAAAGLMKLTGVDVNRFLPDGAKTDPIQEQIAAKNINELSTAIARANFTGNRGITNADLEQSIRSTPNLFNLPGANKQLLDNLEQIQRIKIDRAKFYRNYEREHGGALDYGIHDAWNDYLLKASNIPEQFKTSSLPMAAATEQRLQNPLSTMPPNAIGIRKDPDGTIYYQLNDNKIMPGGRWK